MNIKLDRYLELRKKLLNSSRARFFVENPEAYDELMEYEGIVESQVFASDYEKYMQLLYIFCVDKIRKIADFTDPFYEIYQNNLSLIKRLKEDDQQLLSFPFKNEIEDAEEIVSRVLGIYEVTEDLIWDGPDSNLPENQAKVEQLFRSLIEDLFYDFNSKPK